RRRPLGVGWRWPGPEAIMATVGGLSLSRLERTPDKREVGGSNPPKPTTRGRSSAGRAPALHAGGQRFEPARLHQWDVVGDCSSGPRFLIAARRRHGPRPCPGPARGCGRRAGERRRGGELVAG